MQLTILFLIAISKSIQNANCANVPTYTIERQATVRFPNEQDNGLNTTPKATEEFLIDSPPPSWRDCRAEHPPNDKSPIAPSSI